MKRILLLITSLILIPFSQIFAGTYSGGDGSSGTPYQIANLNDLKELCQTPGDWGSFFIQTADIDASQTQYWDDADDNSNLDLYDDPNDATSTGNNEGFKPIGNGSTEFTGEYNGDGYIISNLFIDRSSTDFVGFFGYTDGADIQDLGLLNVDISGNIYVGGLVGENYNISNINNCYSSGNVSGNINVGGIVGENYASCNITYSYSTVDVSGSSHVGGLVGQNYVLSSINNCYAKGNVSGSNDVGGFVGNNAEFCTISNGYSTGAVSGSNDVGGFVGMNEGTVNTSFWDTQTSNQTNSSGGTARTTTQMKDVSTFAGASWNFDNIWIMGENLNNGYPAIWGGFENTYEPTDIDSPTDGVINIRNIAELRWISENSSSWSSDLELDNDIDASSSLYWNVGDHDADAGTPVEPMGFSPIGYGTNYTGNFNGEGHSISNVYINRVAQLVIGLFSSVNGAEISNIGVVDCDINGKQYVGGLAGLSENSTIVNCYSSGDVSGEDYIGGLVGWNISSAAISSCYSSCNVNADYLVGGLVGLNESNSSINNCYSTGNVNGIEIIGGLAGNNTNSSTINNCYSISNVTGSDYVGGLIGTNNATVSNSFWDITIEPTDNGIGTGKTTEEMKDVTTFLNDGWDFLDETTNGTNDYWGINTSDNNGYPWLEWQGFTNAIVPVISTVNITILGNETAKSGGIISNEGVASITAKGVCWNTSGTPTLSDNYTDEGTGDADFDSYMTGLQVNTQYYVRAYASNSFGIGYGDEKSFFYAAIPTLPEWGLIIFGGLIVVFAVRKIVIS